MHNSRVSFDRRAPPRAGLRKARRRASTNCVRTPARQACEVTWRGTPGVPSRTQRWKLTQYIERKAMNASLAIRQTLAIAGLATGFVLSTGARADRVEEELAD